MKVYLVISAHPGDYHDEVFVEIEKGFLSKEEAEAHRQYREDQPWHGGPSIFRIECVDCKETTDDAV
jgi:hypothetical protein